MKNKVIYSRISQENSKKFSFKDSESPKLSQSQVSVNNHINNSLKNEGHMNRIKQLEEEINRLKEENEYIKANNIQYCKQINVLFLKINEFHLFFVFLKEYEVNKMTKIEKIEINLKDLLHLNDANQLKTLISRLTNNNHRILKEQKDLVSYCNLLTSDFMKINEKVRYFY